jgi:hypothetical protein
MNSLSLHVSHRAIVIFTTEEREYWDWADGTRGGKIALEYWPCTPRDLKLDIWFRVQGSLELSSPCQSTWYGTSFHACINIKTIVPCHTYPAKVGKTRIRVSPLAFGLYPVGVILGHMFYARVSKNAKEIYTRSGTFASKH